ncbi:pyridoxamine 5'-phosphate oxidase family protein [Arthrobacter sp. JSM 101049]|uniref:pyridoxamine 5'-phosphate oxidase family protein n=1 Tax=Arthrobacter sp. JSM 101049 TaxID=929097 RepID=UPI00356AE157
MMYDHADNEPVLVLDEDQCWTLLGRSRHGRIATAFDGQPEITPVNHGIASGRIYLRTAPGNKLAALTVNPSVAFESDGILSDEAWSVVVQGTARVLETEAEIEAARASGVDPWVQTLKDAWVEITPASVSGRHFALGRQPEQLDEH